MDNLVHALLLASKTKFKGEAFFVGDNEPCNTIDLSLPLHSMVTASQPLSFWIPFAFLLPVATLLESLRIPLLSRAELYKVARTHYWKTERARNVLGYEPVVSRQEGLTRMYAYFREEIRKDGYPDKYRKYVAKVKAVVLMFILVILAVIIKRLM